MREHIPESNNHVLSIIRKRKLENQGFIHCGHCPYHKGENISLDKYGKQNWKVLRNTQYKSNSKRYKQIHDFVVKNGYTYRSLGLS